MIFPALLLLGGALVVRATLDARHGESGTVPDEGTPLTSNDGGGSAPPIPHIDPREFDRLKRKNARLEARLRAKPQAKPTAEMPPSEIPDGE